MPTKLDNDILTAAIEGLEAQKQRIDAHISEIRQRLTGGSAGPAATPEPGRKRRKVSAAGRKRMAEAQRKRWAAKKRSGAAPAVSKSESGKPKRKLSAAGRKRIVEATKKRWALVRAAASKAAK
jgi:hypothetical protein